MPDSQLVSPSPFAEVGDIYFAGPTGVALHVKHPMRRNPPASVRCNKLVHRLVKNILATAAVVEQYIPDLVIPDT